MLAAIMGWVREIIYYNVSFFSLLSSDAGIHWGGSTLRDESFCFCFDFVVQRASSQQLVENVGCEEESGHDVRVH